jgi:hypothetical protein
MRSKDFLSGAGPLSAIGERQRFNPSGIAATIGCAV